MLHDLAPIFICAILPISVVLIIALVRINENNRRAQVLLKALECDNNLDVDKLAASLQSPKKTPLEILNRRLLWGCIYGLVGLALVIVGLSNYIAGTSFSADQVTVPLVFGGILLAIGVSFLIVYFVTRKQVVNQNCKTNNSAEQ